jgi:hypothetical protein
MAATTIARPRPGGLKGLMKDKRTLYVGGAVVAGAVGYAWWAKGAGAPEEPPLVFDEFGNPIAGPTPGLTEPQVLDSNLSTTIGTGLRTNAEWTQAATDYLEGRGYNAQAILGALSKFLQRRPLSTVEAELVGAAVASQGWPPEDRPWTIIPATATTPDPGTPKPPAPTTKLPPAPRNMGLLPKGRSRYGIAWPAVPGATKYRYRWETATRRSGWTTVTGTHRDVIWLFRTGTTFAARVQAGNAAGWGGHVRSNIVKAR